MKYFVSFAIPEIYHLGCVEITVDKPIRSFDDIEVISEIIKRDKRYLSHTVVILYWRKFDE